MSINTPNGILDITNAIVRVSKLEFQQATGFDTVLNNVARNTILLSDTTEYSAATTYHNWALKLPNAWAFTADVYLESGTDGAGDHTFKLNFFNDRNTAVTNGYTLGLNGTSLTLSYDGTQLDSATLPSTLNTGAFRKLFVLFERDTFAVAVDGEPVYHYVDTSGPRPRVYGNDPGYVVFYHEAGVAAPRKIKNLKFVNGDKWFKDPNSSNIAYIGGSVGVGTDSPTATLDVAGTSKSTNVVATSGVYGEIIGSNAISASTLTVTSISGDGSGLSGIQSSNVSDFASNVSRIETLESGDLTIGGEKTFSSNLEVGTANLFVDTVTGNVGVGTTNPSVELDVHGTANVGALYSTLTYSNASANIVAWNSSTNEIIDSGLERGFTEHPVEAMTDYKTYVEGHGTYEASASSEQAGNAWKMFDYVSTGGIAQSGMGWSDLYNADGTYQGSKYTADVGGTRYTGEWVQLKTPYAILLSHFKWFPVQNWEYRSPAQGTVLGSNDGQNWHKLTSWSGETFTFETGSQIDVNATTPYQYFRLVIENTGTSSDFTQWRASAMEWRLFAEKPVTRMENVHISGELSSETLQTGYIKWPKVPLKANESEGYVVSASSGSYTAYAASFRLFNDRLIGVDEEYWSSSATYNASTGAHNNTVSTADVGGTVHYGEWVQIQLPQKIALSFFKVYPRAYGAGTFVLERSPNSGSVLGSDDGVNWYLVNKFSGVTYTLESTKSGKKIDVQSSKSYEYYRFVFTTTQVSVYGDRIDMMELQLFEAATGVGAAPTSAKLQVAGSLGMAKGSEFFAGDDVIMELPKHDRPLVKYPEVAMTANSSGGYVAGRSTINNSGWEAWEMFNGIKYTSSDDGWHSANGTYTAATGEYISDKKITDVSGVDYDGEWTSIMMPKPVKLSYFKLYSRANETTEGYLNRLPKDGTLLGSHDGTAWYKIHSFTDRIYQFSNKDNYFYVNDTTHYKYFVLVYEKLGTGYGGINGGDTVNIGEWELYGTEEGDTSVDVVHRSIPNKPSPQHLEVYWDANDSNSYSFADSSNVYDLSGNGVKGAIEGSGNTFDTTYSAWKFTTSSSLKSPALSISGDYVHSMSLWFRLTSEPSAWSGGRAIMALHADTGITVNSEVSAIVVQTDGTLRDNFWGNDIDYTSPFKMNTWHHVVFTYSGTSGTTDTRKIYVDTKLLTDAVTSGDNYGDPLNLPNNSKFAVGEMPGVGLQGAGDFSNARLFSKALNADQVRELYEYDAPRFGHRQNLVALHKGNLGVGVAHPTSRFEVAGADGLQEYPPRAMTGYETYMEGHGVFKVSASSDVVAAAYYAFDHNIGTYHEPYYSDNPYGNQNGDGSYVGGDYTTNGYAGEWLQLQLPYKVKLSRFSLTPRFDWGGRGPKQGVILAYSFIINDWVVVHVHNDTDGVYGNDSGFGAGGTETRTFNVNGSDDGYYDTFRFVTTHIWTPTGSSSTPNIAEWRLFGTPAPSSLEDGHLTLGKALTLPRVSGHPAGAETPRAESLVVHYDTTVDSVVSGSTVVDISGEGNNGTINGTYNYSTSDRALLCGGSSSDYIETGSVATASDFVHSISVWAKVNSNGTNYIASIGTPGTQSNRQSSTLYFTSSGFSYVFYGADMTVPFSVNTNTWYHIVAVRSGGGTFPVTQKLYIDGVDYSGDASWTNTTSTSLSLPTSSTIYFGRPLWASGTFDGQISNFKIWGGVALTAEEVAAEYALGRTGKSINLTDTALCIGGTVPRAQLDVRGILKAEIGLFQNRPYFACDVKRHGLKDNPAQDVYYNADRDDALTLMRSAAEGCRWKLATNSTYAFRTNNVKLVRVLDDTTSETTGVQVPYSGYYHLTHLARTIDINPGTTFWIYSARHAKYIQPSIQAYRFPFGGNSGHTDIGNSISTPLYLEENDIVMFVFRSITVSDNAVSGNFEQFVSLVLI